MKWVVTDTKYLTKPSKDWQPHIPTANTDTAYIEVLFSISTLVIKLAYTLLNKLGTKTEPVLQPGDRVRVCHSQLSM